MPESTHTDLLAAPLLKAEDVAALLTVKRSTVFELSRRQVDPLPSVSIGRAKRFDRAAVAQWVREQAAGNYGKTTNNSPR